MTKATSSYLNTPDIERLRFHLERALHYAEQLQRELPMDHDAYDSLEDLIEQYLGENAFQQLAIVEADWKDWEEAEHNRLYDLPASGVAR